MTVFHKPEWRIVPLRSEAEEFIPCTVSSVCRVLPRKGRGYEVRIAPPSELFPFLQQVAKVTVAQVRESPVSFYLEEDTDGWYFGVLIRANDHYDLWVTRDKPGWALKA